MRTVYVKEDCYICKEVIQYISNERLLYIEEDFKNKVYKVYEARRNKLKGDKLDFTIPFDSIPAVPALFDSRLKVTIVGGSAVIPIVAGTKSLEEVLGGVVVRCKKCGASMFFHKSLLCPKCRSKDDKERKR